MARLGRAQPFKPQLVQPHWPPTGTFALTGSKTTTHAGSLAASILKALTGSKGTSHARNVTPQIGKQLVGAHVTTKAGTITFATAFPLSNAQLLRLEAIVRLHGLISPLIVSDTARGDGTVLHSLSGTSPVTVTTSAQPSSSILTAAHIDLLARWYALIDPMVESETSRTDGTLTQTVSTVGGTTTLTKI